MAKTVEEAKKQEIPKNFRHSRSRPAFLHNTLLSK